MSDLTSSAASDQASGSRLWLTIGAFTLCAVLCIVCASLWQLHLSDQAQLTLLRDQQQLAELEARNTRQQAEAQHLIDRRLLADANKRIEELTQTDAKSSGK